MHLWYVKSTNIGNWWNGNFDVRIGAYNALVMSRKVERLDSEIAITIYDHRPASVQAYSHFKSVFYDPYDHAPRNAAIRGVKDAMNQAAKVRIEVLERSIMIGLHPLSSGFKTKRHLHYTPFDPRKVEFSKFAPKWYWTGVEIDDQEMSAHMFTVTSPIRDVMYEYWLEGEEAYLDTEIHEYRYYGITEHFRVSLTDTMSQQQIGTYRH